VPNQTVDVNVHSTVWLASHDESANGQTKAMGPKCSLTEELVGSVFHNPHFGGTSPRGTLRGDFGGSKCVDQF
jgi:hypothetical protein